MEGSIATCQIAFSFNRNSGNMAWPKVKSGYKYRRSDKTLMSLDSHATTPLSINVEPPNPSHTLLNVLSVPSSDSPMDWSDWSPTKKYKMWNSSTDINCSQSPTISSRSYDSNPSAASLGSPSYSSERSHSPSPPPPPRVFKPCVVCEDKSSGYHYGVSSCEGCKGFFRRSVQKNMQYQCHKDGNCEINKLTRNRCQFCRLKKCFEKGMSKDSVRNDRNKKRKKPEECSTTQSLPEISSKSEEIIKQIVAAHNTTQPDSYSNGVKNDPDLVDLYEQMLASHRATQSTTVPSDGEPSSPSEDRETPNSIRRGFELWEQVTELSSQGIIRIVDFAKKLPNFQNLTVSDQMTLLKGACLEVMILRLTSRYNSEDDTIVFHNGTVVFRQEMAELGGIMDSVFQFAASLSKMGVDETELAMLSAVCLISGDRSGLQEIEAIDKMQEPILVALKQYMIRRRPSNPFTFPKLLMKLTDLRSISVKASTRITFYYDKKQKRLVFKNSELSPADHDVQSRISSDVNDIFGIVHTFKDLKINCIEEALITLWLLVNPPPDVAKFLDSYDTDKPITST